MIVIIPWVVVSYEFNALVFNVPDLALGEQNPAVGDIENRDVGGGLAINFFRLNRNSNCVSQI